MDVDKLTLTDKQTICRYINSTFETIQAAYDIMQSYSPAVEEYVGRLVTLYHACSSDLGKNLVLIGSKITFLPEGLVVDKHLDLSGSAITFLPKGLSVGEDLIIVNTSITSLPEGLSVGKDLIIVDTDIISLPKSLFVSGEVYGL